MIFDIFIPYNQGASVDIKDNLNGYYETEQDYADALVTEDNSNGAIVYNTIYNTMTRGGIGNYINYNSIGRKYREIKDKIVYAKSVCKLYSPNGFSQEDVDSMIDKFVSQDEFLVTVDFDMSEMDGEFEEELREWSKETYNILLLGRKITKDTGSKNEGDIFIEKNIPRRELRLSFLNKSGKRVNFALRACEVEQKLSKSRYILYVKRMEILK
jgi:hypothetical protein